MAAGHSDTFHHVRDFSHFELPRELHLHLPSVAGLQITKFMVLQVVAAVLIFVIFRGLAKRVRSGEPVSGGWWNFWEMLVLYIRDQVVRPVVGGGHHDHGDHHEGDHAQADSAYSHPADKYLPFVLTCFFYVLFCNLLGAVPWLGSATGEINVTAALAIATFGAVLIYGARELGVVAYWTSLVPSMDLPGPMRIVLVPMIWAIEVLGLFIKHGVLAIRLFANIMAGHTVIAVILGFIALSANSSMYYLVLPASIFGQVAIGLLELFVAFLQAYIFAFLATLFIGTAVHPH